MKKTRILLGAVLALALGSCGAGSSSGSGGGMFRCAGKPGNICYTKSGQTCPAGESTVGLACSCGDEAGQVTHSLNTGDPCREN